MNGAGVQSSTRNWCINLEPAPVNYSWLPITRTLTNSILPLTRTNFHIPSGHFRYNFTFDNSNLFLFPLKVRVIGSRQHHMAKDTSSVLIIVFKLIHARTEPEVRNKKFPLARAVLLSFFKRKKMPFYKLLYNLQCSVFTTILNFIPDVLQ